MAFTHLNDRSELKQTRRKQITMLTELRLKRRKKTYVAPFL